MHKIMGRFGKFHIMSNDLNKFTLIDTKLKSP